MKKIVFIFFFLFNLYSFFAQNEHISTLLKTYKTTKDSLIIKEALMLALQNDDPLLIRQVNIAFGIENYRKNNLLNILKSSNNLLNNFKRFNDSLSLAKYYHYKALYFRKKYITDSCFYYYHKSKNISILLKDSLSTGRRLLSMARIQERERDYLGSEITTIEALRFLEPINAIRYISSCYNNLGIINSNFGKYDEARENYKKSYDIGYLNNDNRRLNTFLDYQNNTALTYQLEKKYEKSNQYYLEITSDSIREKSTNRFYTGIENISYNNFKLGKKEEALKGFLEVLNYRKSINDKKRLSATYSILTEFYLSQKQYKRAKFYAKKGVEAAKETNYIRRILENYNYLSKLEKGEKGKLYLRKIIGLKDSIAQRERSLKNQFAKVRYETEKKEHENTTLKVENDKKQLEIEKEQQQKLIGWLFAGAGLLVIGFGYLIVSNRKKKLLFISKLKQIEAREKERQQIAKSLHDEVAGDIRILHKQLVKNNLIEESNALETVKDNVRTLSHQLSSVSFSEVSFKNQIINLVSDYYDASFIIKIKEINTIDWLQINNLIKRTLFLAIRESIQNIDKYASANNVILEFTNTKKSIVLHIIDDGNGFEVKNKKKGIGLKNMKERIEEINGVFTLTSELKKGTRISLEIPKNGR